MEGSKADIYTRVTNEIVKAIEDGASEFVMPWHRSSTAAMPRNAATGAYYRGINTVALWAASRVRGYIFPYWASYRQWAKLGAQVRRHERSSIVVFYKRDDRIERSDAGEDISAPRAVLQYSSVFNASQVDGWTLPEPPDIDKTERIEKVEAFIDSLNAEIVYGGDLAFYTPRFDRIHMPHRKAFHGTGTSTSTEAFYSTLLHEHIHWSGHLSRLNRDLAGRFGTSAYAMEELVAELGAAFLCAELGITVHPRKDHAAYVANWLIVLRQQKSAIFTASSAAATACRYLAELSSEKQTGAIGAPA